MAFKTITKEIHEKNTEKLIKSGEKKYGNDYRAKVESKLLETKLAHQLQETKESLGIKSVEIAKGSGLAKTRMSEYKNGKTMPSIPNIVKILEGIKKASGKKCKLQIDPSSDDVFSIICD